jgi:hypothetical protein
VRPHVTAEELSFSDYEDKEFLLDNQEGTDARWNRKKEMPSLSAYKRSGEKTGRRRE